MNRARSLAIALIAPAAFALNGPVHAGALDLRTLGASGTLNDGLYFQNGGGAGTGQYNVFLRIQGPQSNPFEEGYNTDARTGGQQHPETPDASDSQTQGRLLSATAILTFNTTDYYQFGL